jgi:dCTP deaminase
MYKMETSKCVLSDRDIIKEIQTRKLLIYPFNKENLTNISYDVTLGENFYRASENKTEFLIPWSEESVSSYWGSPQYATSDESTKLSLGFGKRYILMEPGETILAHTNEFIGGYENICCLLMCKSSLSRIGISVCKDPSLGNVGYVNRWTIQITNSTKQKVPLLVGSRIAQIMFLYTGIVSDKYDKNGLYQNQFSTIEELVDNWSVNNMLPKCSKFGNYVL